MFGSTDGASGLEKVVKGNSNSPSTAAAGLFQQSGHSYRQLEQPDEISERSNLLAETSPLGVGGTEALKLHVDDVAGNVAEGGTPDVLDSISLRAGLDDQRSADDGNVISTSRDSSAGRPNLRPPAADVSPPLSLRRSQREEDRRRRWSEEDDTILPVESGRRRGLGVATASKREQEVSQLSTGDADSETVKRPQQGVRNRSIDDGVCLPSRPGNAMVPDDPLHR